MSRADLPKPEQFRTVADEYGVMALDCPVCRWQSDQAELPDMDLGTQLAAARQHIDRVHDRCDAWGDFGHVDHLERYVCRRKVHDDGRHEWVLKGGDA